MYVKGDFHTKTIGLEVVQEKSGPDRAFLSLGDDHHQLGLFQTAARGRPLVAGWTAEKLA